ncbi:MAG: hypothetical protein HT580_10455 [Dechloromonas sp.]|nr:MAG: hypothetical protein HT580_10455 [Dechloromonas sp.]
MHNDLGLLVVLAVIVSFVRLEQVLCTVLGFSNTGNSLQSIRLNDYVVVCLGADCGSGQQPEKLKSGDFPVAVGLQIAS